jgi:hypothetical protein
MDRETRTLEFLNRRYVVQVLAPAIDLRDKIVVTLGKERVR